MNYSPHTQEDISSMLETIGLNSTDDLFGDITPALRADPYNIADGKSEFEVYSLLKKLSDSNATGLKHFLGGGFYDHYIPSVVDKLAGRGEFYTAYTPYQPECSQGTLQALYEYQTLMCRITGMEISNASVYDGGTALAEAILMAMRITDRNKVIIDKCLNPLYLKIILTYLSNISCEIIQVDPEDLCVNKNIFEAKIDENTAAVVFQNPNFFGSVFDYTGIIENAHSKGCLAIVSVYPVSLGIIKTPYDMGFDIVTGDGQSLGNPLNFGGPYFGFITTFKKYIRHMPGRIVGKTVDSKGNTGYVLTLQTREQHIRRQKATSNICTNQNLCALRALIHLTSIGKQGFIDLSVQNYSKTGYAITELSKLNKIRVLNSYPVFNEFVLHFDTDAQMIFKKTLNAGIAPGIPLGQFYPGMNNCLLVCITEKQTKMSIKHFISTLSDTIEGSNT